jgi:hypothetical protein
MIARELKLMPPFELERNLIERGNRMGSQQD